MSNRLLALVRPERTSLVRRVYDTDTRVHLFEPTLRDGRHNFPIVNTVATAVQPKHVPSLLEAMGSDGQCKEEQYCLAADLYIAGLIDWERCKSIQSSRKIIPGFAESAKTDLHFFAQEKQEE